MTIRHSPERDATASQADTAPPTTVATRAPGTDGADRTGPPPGGVPVPDHAGPPPGGVPVPDHAGPAPGGVPGPDLTPMLEARSIALVGASPRPGTFGQRMLDEVTRSPARPEVYLVNPRYAEIGGRRCVPSLADLPGPVDLVLLAVPDAALEQQLALAARRGDRSAVIFGNAHEDPTPAAALGHPAPAEPPPPSSHPATAHSAPSHPDSGSWMYQTTGSSPPIGTFMADAAGPVGSAGLVGSAGPLRERLAGIAGSAGMQLCGAGCMGFVNVARGLRAIGYTEPDPLPVGPIALVTHSGSVFSMMLRTRRAIGYSLAVSSGQELVTAAPSYLDYALGLPETKVLALVLEAIREPGLLRRVLARSAERDIPVVLLTAGRSASGRALVTAHSGALAADDGGWEALARAYGVHRVGDLAELADALELFAIGRRGGPPGGPPGAPRPAPAAVATAGSPARPPRPASRPCMTPAWNARTRRIWPRIAECRSPPSARRPSRGWPTSWTPA